MPVTPDRHTRRPVLTTQGDTVRKKKKKHTLRFQKQKVLQADHPKHNGILASCGNLPEASGTLQDQPQEHEEPEHEMVGDSLVCASPPLGPCCRLFPSSP